MIVLNNGGTFEPYILIQSITLNKNYNRYSEYRRTKITTISVLLNSLSLCATILNIMSSVFAMLYSSNFDPYKIIEKIL